MMQGNFTAVPIAEGRKVISELGQRIHALGDEKLPGHLAVLTSISQKKLKVGRSLLFNRNLHLHFVARWQCGVRSGEGCWSGCDCTADAPI